MESRLGWYRAVQASEEYHVTVLSATAASQAIELASVAEQLEVELVSHNWFEQFLMRLPCCFYLAYRLWHRRVYRHAREMHRQQPFHLVHQVSFCGFREPGDCWRLEIPFVWGPLGGTQNVPWKFLNQLNWTGALSEACRTLVNYCQLNFSPRVKQAMHKASVVLAANREVLQSLRQAHQREVICQLETGIELRQPPRFQHRPVDQPLRILWAGRLESWKALPLLLKALAQLPSNVRYELRVVGAGSCEQKWKRLASRLGLDDRVHWAGWPIYAEREEHYEWADLYAFTSLRDTSGTGLLEALAAGVPLIGLNHQGARDVMTAQCALPIAVDFPEQVISDLQAGLLWLVSNPSELQQLSAGAYRRAQDYHWDRLGGEMLGLYKTSLGERASERFVEDGSAAALLVDESATAISS